MLRKHINSMTIKDVEEKSPFFAWECLTLFTKRREINLVIKDEDHMKFLTLFLIRQLQTVDGKLNSGKRVLQALDLERLEEWKRGSL